MQTFLPYSDFSKTAEVLDRARLGKQRVETLQIMTALLEGRGWTAHPATNMWRGYESALMRYQEAICHEWLSRGYKDTCLEKTRKIFWTHNDTWGTPSPPWLGEPEFHISHRSNLIRKMPEHYGELWPEVPDDVPYYWPV